MVTTWSSSVSPWSSLSAYRHPGVALDVAMPPADNPGESRHATRPASTWMGPSA